MQASDDSDDEPLGAKPSGVGSPVRPGRFSASRPATSASSNSMGLAPRAGGASASSLGAGGPPRPKCNGDVLGGGGGDDGGDETRAGAADGYAHAATCGGGGGGGGGSARPQSAALNRARDIQLRKRSERLAMMGMAVANRDGPLHAEPRPALPAAAADAAAADDAAARASAASEAPRGAAAGVPVGGSLAQPPAVPRFSAAPPPAYDEGDATPRAAFESAVQPLDGVADVDDDDDDGRGRGRGCGGSGESGGDGGSSGRGGGATVARAAAASVGCARAEADSDGAASHPSAPEPTAQQPPFAQSRAGGGAVPRPVAARPAGAAVRARAALDLSDIRRFLMRPAPEGSLVQCHISRSKAGFLSSYPKYTMFLKQPGTADLPLLAARKRGQSKSSNYLISLDADDMQRASGAYFGKLRSNFIGTEFVLYDNGISPDKADTDSKADAVRTELCAVLYKQNVLYTRGPRRMTVLAPALTADGERTVLRPSKSNDESSILEKHKADERDADLTVLKNKSPKWNDVANAYVLNFNGRVTQPSVKNFQIVDEKDSEEVVIMQFGRVGDNDFTCDFQYPLSPLQAFGIALSSFDYKIACE